MKEFKQHILEKLKISIKEPIKYDEFCKTRKSLSDSKNDVKLQYSNRDEFIDFIEFHLINDGVIDEIPFKDIPGSKRLFRFDGNDFYDNIIDTRVGLITADIFPPKFGEGYCRTVKFMIENYSDIMNINIEL
jgi:hypothetical protein